MTKRNYSSGQIEWFWPHAWVVGIISLLCIAVMIPQKEVYFGFVTHAGLVGSATLAVYILFNGFVRSAIGAIDRFEPRSVTQAKAANEQIKLLATLLNNLAVAALITAVISQLWGSGKTLDGVAAAFSLLFALHFHHSAKMVAGAIKDESAASF